MSDSVNASATKRTARWASGMARNVDFIQPGISASGFFSTQIGVRW